MREAVAATGRKQLVVAGISFEVCASLPAIAAKEEGYDPRVVLDASGTFYDAKRMAGLHRLTALGIQVTDYATVAVELLRDNADSAADKVYGALDFDFSRIVQDLMKSGK